MLHEITTAEAHPNHTVTITWAGSVFELMRQVNRESGTTFLMMTHDLDLARRCDRSTEVVDGGIAVPA